MIITPTTGAVVHYLPTKEEDLLAFRERRPLAATIAYVWGDRLVNLMVIDGGGTPFNRKSVVLFQEGDPTRADDDCGYCKWPEK